MINELEILSTDSSCMETKILGLTNYNIKAFTKIIMLVFDIDLYKWGQIIKSCFFKNIFHN